MFLKFKFGVIFCCVWILVSCSREQESRPVSIAANVKHLETILLKGSRYQYGMDTLQLYDSLQYLQETKSDLDLFAYDLLMADGFSIAFDNINTRSDTFFESALVRARHLNQKALEFIVAVRKGYYFHTYRNTDLALPYFLKAADLYKQIEIQDVPLVSFHLQCLANFSMYIGKSKEAIHYLESAIPFGKPLSRELINLHNTIGVILRRDSLYDRAKNYYGVALKIAEEAKDSVWIGILNGNLGVIEKMNGNLDQAIKLLKINIELSTKYEEKLDAMHGWLELGQFYIAKGQWANALNCAQEAERYFEDKPYFVAVKVQYLEILARVFSEMGQYQDATNYFQALIKTQDILRTQKDAELLEKIFWDWEVEKYERALRHERMQREQVRTRDLILGVLILLILIIVILLVSRSRQRIKIRSMILEKEQHRLAREKNEITAKLTEVKLSLEEVMDVTQKNDELIHQLQNTIQTQENLKDFLKMHMMTDERWILFKHLFEKKHPDFMAQLSDKYPTLSEYNIRLMTFQKLGLSNQSISHVLGISVEGVKKAKQRLRHKLKEANHL